MILTLVRHATLVLEYAGRRLLVDPMLGEPGSAPPVENRRTSGPTRLFRCRCPRPSSWRAQGLKEIIRARNPGDWVDDQLADIDAKRAGRGAAAA